MWKEIQDQGTSYEPVSSEEHGEDSHLSYDDVTLAGSLSDDIPLSVEELGYEDPVDGKGDVRVTVDGSISSPSSLRYWFKDSIRSWRSRDPSNTRGRSMIGTSEIDEKAGRRSCARITHPTLQWLIWPLPSFLHGFFVDGAEPEVHRPTDYLDGLRGVASLFVFFNHYLLQSNLEDLPRYGFGADGHVFNVFQLPFLRTLVAGSAMVSVFFVISGYVLSQRCIAAFRAGKHDKLVSALSSMAFRRGMRLFLPSIAAGLCCSVAVILGFVKPQYPHGWTVGGELLNFMDDLNQGLFRIWGWDAEPHFFYAHQLWTIPLEYKCSMILFLQILIVARCTQYVRLALQFSTLFYLFFVDRWEVAAFIAGMVIAELNIINDERKRAKAKTVANDVHSLPTQEPASNQLPPSKATSNIVVQLLLWACFILGWYLTGYPPVDAARSPGYGWLVEAWSDLDAGYKFRFWLTQAGILLVFAISFLPAAQAIFTTRIARYLGQISYALYLVHGLMNRTVRLVLWQAFWHPTPGVGQFTSGFIFSTLLYFPLVIWASDLFWRAVDVPTVKFAKWVEGKCFSS